MIKFKEIESIIASWASSLPYKVRIHLFGSYLKGFDNPSDLDVSLELLHPDFSEKDRTLLWCKNAECWRNYLSQEIGMEVDLQLCEEGKNIPKYLKEASLLIYESPEKGDTV